MAVVTRGSSVPSGRKPMKSRNIAMLSVAGVIAGAWLLFRLMAPQRGTFVASNEEMEAFRGGDKLQTNVGEQDCPTTAERIFGATGVGIEVTGPLQKEYAGSAVCIQRGMYMEVGPQSPHT
ncbi:hypothetical protein NUU61_004618 [Penicillium alfredii]|uniref:Uncharacterized protein n=1 Tax=Penicillium alfredii TaxID=1506179 RepID=A0A9W9FLG6_9EURO|nr:uncharacterized protein NUU61_004618 [Penicillium alfredii]KAJ5102396.1 hypothetical protein NUU61_004618 [Penicillium alfredii]